jgi:hypothetical protein
MIVGRGSDAAIVEMMDDQSGAVHPAPSRPADPIAPSTALCIG